MDSTTEVLDDERSGDGVTGDGGADNRVADDRAPDDRLPYDRYVHADTLHRLQRTTTDNPGEMSFLMISQIMELYFKLIDFELRAAQRALRGDEVAAALSPLRRAALHLEGLNASWQGLRWMSPADFNRFRANLGDASGMQSAMYRHLEFRLGLKTASLTRPHRGNPEQHEALRRSLAEPSVWDDAIAVLARHGYDIPAALLDRDHTVEHEPDTAVEAAWADVLADPSPDNHVRRLADALTEVAEQFAEWRYRHLSAVRRAMGAKSGTGGTNGIGWLEQSMNRVVFPELWSARTRV
ncbi:tryptophan 2,3-dioxygenase [Prauserella halophila]|uniref:Tryptophan 2,3-dioxygenase n=1 Tax=Prauserella halophila TaxID=185641 RepID=A0ABP4H5P5_9PSEU|nr:tryptophan 2,3-dioxygenase family protein [Prauserella halophila]MCP2238078.1 tryptophan 2,3-dioxygenase [Prauserella halophila]